MNRNKKQLSSKDREELLKILKVRFEKNSRRHKGVDWDKLVAKLETNPGKLWSINEMEKTGGEPDVAGYDKDRPGLYINNNTKEKKAPE